VIVTGRQVLAGVVSVVVLAAVVTGIVILGSPSEERARRLDRRLVEELSSIKTAVDSYYSKNGILPESLDELWKGSPGLDLNAPFDVIRDPVPPNAYRYRVVAADAFELCGTFERASEPRVSSGVDVWQHLAGAHCFPLKVDKRSTQ
jgi:hypothetical protein